MAETLGERLKRLRVQRGMTAAELGRKAGVGENAIFKLEAGLSKVPSFLTGVKLASALEVSAAALAGEREAKRSSARDSDDAWEDESGINPPRPRAERDSGDPDVISLAAKRAEKLQAASEHVAQPSTSASPDDVEAQMDANVHASESIEDRLARLERQTYLILPLIQELRVIGGIVKAGFAALVPVVRALAAGRDSGPSSRRAAEGLERLVGPGPGESG